MEVSLYSNFMHTTHAILAKLQQSDYDDILLLHNDEQVRTYLGGPIDLKDFHCSFECMCSAIEPEAYWIMREKQTTAFMGLVSIDGYHDKKRYELSYQLLPEFWGKGYATEVLDLMIKYAFSELGLEELVSETQKKNVKSIRLLERLGMQKIDELERFGEQQIVYAIKHENTVIPSK